jgi:hypothetical protein
MFAYLQPHMYAPGIVPVSDIQLLEGIADLARKVPRLPGHDRDMMKLIAGWRWAATKHGGASLQIFLLDDASRYRSVTTYLVTAAR